MTKINKVVMLISVLLIFFFILGGTKLFQPLPETKKEYDYLALMSEVIALVKLEYVEEVQPEKKFPGAFSGMLSSLDNFSSYLDSKRSYIYKLYNNGNAFSSGIYGEKRYDYFYITDIEPGSPADNMGIKPGDAIKIVNGKSIFGKSFWEMHLSLLTDTSSTLEIVLINPDSIKENNKLGSVKLKTIPIKKQASLTCIDKEIHLLTIPRFDQTNVDLLKEHLTKIVSDNANSQSLKLIIDLRQYSGGNLEAFLEIAKLFFKTSTQITLKSKGSKKQLTVSSPSAINYNAVILVDASTRMYGELLAILFKENYNKKITIIGTKTRGFIAELKQFPLEDGSSILLTDGNFYLKGKNLASQGLVPDIKIKQKNISNIIKLAVDKLKKLNE